METKQHEIAVLFEVVPADRQKQEYLDIATKLKPELEKINGFISIERFQSIYNPNKAPGTKSCIGLNKPIPLLGLLTIFSFYRAC